MIPVLEYLIKNHDGKQSYYRELGVLYDLTDNVQKAVDLRVKMKTLGFEDAAIKEPDEDSDFLRVPRPLLRTAAYYPREASDKGTEGYVMISFSINIDGSVHDCKILESTHKIFEETACKAALQYRYYPAAAEEKKVIIPNVEYKLTFKLEGKNRPKRKKE